MKECIYFLGDMPRLLHFPYQLYQIGWMPEHVCHHKNKKLDQLFFCFSFNKRTKGISELNGQRQEGTTDSTFSMLPPDTVINTVKAQQHDELFFVYPATCYAAFTQLFGQEKFVLFNSQPSSELQLIIGEIRRVLNNLHEAGAADSLDRLAFSFLTGMFLANAARKERHFENNFRIEELAADLLRGQNLHDLVKRYGFSRRNFFREWHKFCPEVTPTQYRLNHQLAQAEALLLQSDIAIAQIINLCKFSSNIQFCRLFRARHGCSATEFRKKQGKINLPGLLSND